MIVLHSQPLEASDAMAADHALLNAVEAGQLEASLRFYEWERASVSLGRFQSVARTLQDNYTLSDVGWVRRFTGGRAILHGDDLTVSVVCDLARIAQSNRPRMGAAAIYDRFLPWFRAAFAALNVNIVAGEACRITGSDGRGDCFDIISQADLVDAKDGTKRLGAAIHIAKSGFLLQASIPLRTPARTQHQEYLRRTLFRGAAKIGSAREVTPLAVKEVLEALMSTWVSFSITLGLNSMDLSIRTDTLPEAIAREALKLRHVLYQDARWTWRGQIPAGLIDSRERL